MTQTYLLLRGLTREARHWGAFPQQLSAALGATACCIDLPGNGKWAHQASPADLQQTLKWLRDELAVQNIQPPFVLVSMSMGAMLSCLWAERYPYELSGAALINTSLRPFSPWYERLRPSNYLRLLNMAIRGAGRDWESSILHLTSGRFDVNSEQGRHLVYQWQRIGQSAPVSRANAWRQLRAAIRFQASPSPPSVPLLLLSSAGDRLVNPDCSRLIARRWGIPHYEHPWAGHDLPLDAPDWVIEQVRVWQNEVSRQDRGGQSG